MIRSAAIDPDVAILAAWNTNVHLQLVRTARACNRLGLTVRFLATDLKDPVGEVIATCRRDGFPASKIPVSTWRTGPFSYPAAPATLRLYLGLLRSLSSFRPGLLLTHTDAGGIWRALHAWAKRVGVPGAALQEGASARPRPGFEPGPAGGVRRLGSRLFRRLGPRLIRTDVRIYEFADHALVSGEAMRELLIGRGRDPGATHVVGNPAYDHIQRRAGLAPMSRRAVLFAQQPQPNSDVELEACDHVVRTCVDRLGCRLLFRPHPRGDLTREAIARLADATSSPGLVEIVDSGDVTDHLDDASVFLTYYSSSAYNAAIAGLPLVSIDWVSLLYALDAADFGAAIAARTPAELEPALRAALDDPVRRAALYEGAGPWLAHHVGLLDGGSADRVARTIRGLIGRDPVVASDRVGGPEATV